MIRVKIRGIYSTALTKFLLDEGYKVVDPSDVQKNRFNIELNDPYPLDCYILDYKDGIKIVGPKAEVIAKEISEKIGGFLMQDIVGRVYKGELIGNLSNFGGEHLIKIKNYLGILKEPILSKAPIVQVKSITDDGKILLTQDIKLFGKYITLISKNNNIYPKEMDDEEIERLSRIEEKDYSIQFTQFSIKRNLDEIRGDIENLKNVWRRFMENSEKELRFNNSFIILFSKREREILDNIRSKVVPTSRKHHLARILNIQDIELVEEIDPNKVDILEKRLIDDNIEIFHRRFIGRDYYRTVKKIKYEYNSIEFIYFFKSPGFYDGLKVRKYVGDYQIGKINEGDISYEMNYYRRDGTLIGKYINFNTPIEIFGNKIYYIDLEIDLIFTKGKWVVVDVEEFDRILEEIPKLEDYRKEIFERIKLIIGGENYELE